MVDSILWRLEIRELAAIELGSAFQWYYIYSIYYTHVYTVNGMQVTIYLKLTSYKGTLNNGHLSIKDTCFDRMLIRNLTSE